MTATPARPTWRTSRSTAGGFHPAVELFPLMDGAEFDDFVKDISEHGQMDPIAVHDTPVAALLRDRGSAMVRRERRARRGVDGAREHEHNDGLHRLVTCRGRGGRRQDHRGTSRRRARRAEAAADRGVGGCYCFDLTTTVRRSVPRRASTALLRGNPLPVARRQHFCEMLVTDDIFVIALRPQGC